MKILADFLFGFYRLIKMNKMKTIKLIGILALITSLTACNQTEEENNIQTEILGDWKSLSENNYSINYPDNWELNKAGQMGTSFILFSPLSSKQDNFKENVNLLVQDLKGHDLDLDKYVEISEGQIKTLVMDGELIESKRITTGNLNYHKAIYTGRQGTFNLKFEQYFWVVENKAIILTLTCEEDQFDNYQIIGEKILNSFNLN
jgi:hypothetical protein